MVENMKVNTKAIKNMDLVYLYLKMDVYTKVNGKMVNNMAAEYIKRKK